MLRTFSLDQLREILKAPSLALTPDDMAELDKASGQRA